ncbi:MAG: hypothetical protein GY694_21845, partial [Gammaproteobacteria bacterium]|nr:hypothetical protein [Gammaproteobacteria bacterium]
MAGFYASQPSTQYAAGFIGQGVMLYGKVLDANTIKTELGDIHGKVPAGCKENCP